MKLKQYQENTLSEISSFLKEMQKNGPKHAFISVTEQPYLTNSFGNIPFICVKIPTGGGKTLVACYVVEKIMNAFPNKLGRGIVLWFTPSEAIKSQTLKKFKDRKDWHRKALDEAFENNIKVFSNEEALSIRKEDVNDNLCVIIASIDAFRKDKSIQKKYKVYQENGALIDHFQNINEPDHLDRDEEETVINSLANVISLSNPLIVIDEGHKAKTELSNDILKQLNPFFIIEYTATPRPGSNILVEVHASELKAEDMVKIPIVLESATQWQNSILGGIEKRNELEKKSKKLKSEYIRPIALLQAQPHSKVSDNITVEKILSFLEEKNIPKDQIAVKTSTQNDIGGVDLFNKDCKIRYIITVNALAEGWDCSFAYVLVSVANLGANIAVEQIIGRIIRLPNAKRKADDDFNMSYIFASARNFNEAASKIISGLESNGYSGADIIQKGSNNTENIYEAKKKYKDILKVPMISLDKEKLSFEELIGEDFELAKQDPKFKFEIHYDNDGRAIIDIKEDDEWMKGKQLFLNLRYNDKSYTESELVQWLDKKLRFTLLEKSDKVAFLKKAIDYQLKVHTLTELSVNRFVLAERMKEVIENRLEEYSKKRFNHFIAKKKINVNEFDSFPSSISLKKTAPIEFNKNYYEKIDKLNGEEISFIQRLDLDTLPNIKYWVRNREKIDPFYIQGWRKNKFYPDFIAVTKNDEIIALEWKGGDRVSNEDTKYKNEIGELWENLGKGKLHFYLVHNGNVEEVLGKIANL